MQRERIADDIYLFASNLYRQVTASLALSCLTPWFVLRKHSSGISRALLNWAVEQLHRQNVLALTNQGREYWFNKPEPDASLKTL